MTRTVGFPIVKPPAVFGAEPYMHDLIAGITRTLIPSGDSLLVRVVPRRSDLVSVIRSWVADGSVDGVILIDLTPQDPALRAVKDLALPAVVTGDPETGAGLPTVWSQDEVAMVYAVRAMADAGHADLGHITGPSTLAHTLVRSRRFRELVSDAHLRGVEVEGDYSEQAGYDAAFRLLTGRKRVTCIIADNDLMAVGALRAATHLGLTVPTDVSVVAWDDSDVCRSTTPALSAMTHDVQGVGEVLGRVIRDVMAGAHPGVVTPAAAEFIARGSTAEPAMVG